MDGNWKATVDRLRAIRGVPGDVPKDLASRVADLFEQGHPQGAVAALIEQVFEDSDAIDFDGDETAPGPEVDPDELIVPGDDSESP